MDCKYRKVKGTVKVFFDYNENYGDHRYVREKIAAETRKIDAEVADLYLADTKDGYSLNELGNAIDRARRIFGIEVLFEAGSASWIGWDGMNGRDPDDFYDDQE
ncbi:MAG: hypothetical protein J2P36_08290, partial [Ktedonobacteraceae bacterium]|nr:hypothetical protein [Ktedonobacteraceae bacterium]